MKISNELSENIIDEQRFYEALNTLVNDIENVSARAISIIRDNFKDEVNDTVESLTVFSNEAKFKSFIEDARNSYLSAIKYIPDTEKARINGIYDNLYDTCIGAVKDLQRLFSLPYRLDYDGKKLVANRDEVSEAIQVNFKVELSEDERKYFSRVANVVNSLQEMNDFEKSHGYVQFSYNGINQLSKYGYFRKVNPMPFYQKFDEQHFIDALKNGTLGVEKDD
jgi:hypothetical protein